MTRLTLTFDNGPWSGPTEAVLDILAERGLKATFFVVGERLRDPPARRAAERAKAEGHWIGNHTLTHGTPLGLREDPGHPQAEIGAAQALLGDLVHPERLFRPNGKGRLSPHLLSRAAADYLVRHRYTLVTWSNVPRDWEEPRVEWPERALTALAGRDWDLLVLHEHYLAPMMATLPAFLDRVVGEGVTIVQEFPEACVPLRQGVAAPGFAGLVTG
ncbi:MAG TPA: polysaccharide deacetylase family protein [Microvirga sp.]|jgi:peptidoglycan/xylan/chitin deacetylase (PgdA/CDA1 family)|nr:polysaccharide deacetylase family protein [Microvirga sp.]